LFFRMKESGIMNRPVDGLMKLNTTIMTPA